MDRQAILIQSLAQNGISLSDDRIDKLIRYYDMLIEKNKVMNLTAITDFNDVAVKHFADSLSIGRAYEISSQKIIDVGTGAGFPGIPLKIMYPDCEIVLLDSLRKRLDFLDEVISDLHLTGIRTVHARAEEGARNSEFRQKFDVAVSRAVANLSTLVEYCLPFVSVGGSFIAYKGANADSEIADASFAIKCLGGGKVQSVNFTLYGTDDYERSLVVVPKFASTSDKYPRAGGKPSKEPLH